MVRKLGLLVVLLIGIISVACSHNIPEPEPMTVESLLSKCDKPTQYRFTSNKDAMKWLDNNPTAFILDRRWVSSRKILTVCLEED